MTNATLNGKPYAGNPHVRFEVGGSRIGKPRRGSLLYKVEVVIADPQARAADQAKVVKKVAVSDTTYGASLWKVSLAIDEEKMPDGQKLADTLAAFVNGENGIKVLAGATEAKTVTIPADAATSGLYYSLLVSPDLGFVQPAETTHVLANGSDDLSITVASAADTKAPRFFKMKVNLLKE